MVRQCAVCEKHAQGQRSESLLLPLPPDYPWAMVGSDIFDWKKKNYLLTVDYYSKYIEAEKLHNTSASKWLLSCDAEEAAVQTRDT